MGSNIHGISCTANNYLKQAWNDIKNEYEKNQTYSITLFENTLVCFMRLYNELRGSDSNLLIVFYVQIMPDDLVMQLHRF
ncbi:hypothetical protein E5P51_05955 [Escherichia coli]|nr:hypothetical protein CXF17_05920 [Escherichia coli]TGI30557.1 hypothetical protein E5P51_05955 [Escherichia coli]